MRAIIVELKGVGYNIGHLSESEFPE